MYYYVHITPSRSLKEAEKLIAQALVQSDRIWRAHAVQGALHSFRRQWDKAHASFLRALELNVFQTKYGAWYYTGFLMATGRVEDALALAQERARIYPNDLPSQIACGIFLYLGRRFDEALPVLSAAGVMNSRQWLTFLASALLAFARNEPAAAHVIAVHQLLGDEVFPGLLALCVSAILQLRSTSEWGPSRKNASGTLFEQIYMALDELIDTVPKPPKQLEQLTARSQDRYVSPLQLALAYLSINDAKDAIDNLEKACNEPNPITAWLSVLPLFDALREKQEFQRLL
jgi:tetratricopeptide (TPR) repeat protein